MRIYSPLLLLLLLVGCTSTPKAPVTHVAPAYNELNAVEAFYGVEARKRVQAWRQLLRNNRGRAIDTRLQVSNDFFNHLKFEDDIEHWWVEDYWATPIETIATNGGDCEDFAIGKYFTLTALGVPDQCLRITYVKALTVDKPHMVLTYQCNAGDEALILDSLVKSILPAEDRTDLVPVYSFNAKGLWLGAQGNNSTKLSNGGNISRWRQLLQRVDKPLKP
ncbi:MAG: sulfate adenylyltransferase [Methylococcaceae bacterium]|nr:sulfate adenylyltransferase [Methylococcaceae bacterium]